MSLIKDWTPEMDNLFDLDPKDDQYEKHSRIIVKDVVEFMRNPENKIDPKEMNIKDFERINGFIAKLCDIGNLREPKTNEDRYLLISTALFIVDNGWDAYKGMMIARRRKDKK